MPHRLAAVTTSLITVAAGILAAPAAIASQDGGPWGPTHVLYDGRSHAEIAQATTTGGTTVAVFSPHPRRKPSHSLVSIRPSGGEWSTPAPLSPGRALRPTVIAWGTGHLSVIWASHSGPDNYLFHQRTLEADGTLGAPEKLIKATYAYPAYQAAVNGHGQVALAWSNGDLYDRVAVRQPDGTWTRYPKVPVLHPTSGGLQYISNPRALFLDDAGRVSDITWGSVDDSDWALWLARPDADGWTTQRIGPVEDGQMPYGYVDAADFASNPRGDLVVTWEQKDGSGDWSSRLRFAPAGEPLGPPTTLGDYWCFIDDPLHCAAVALADDGTATVAYAHDAGGDDIVVEMTRRSPEGDFTPAQAVSGEFWKNQYDGVQVAGNGRGDAVVSFTGGRDRSSTDALFARCPAASACAKTLYLEDGGPSWLDPWTTSMGDDAEVTVTWSVYWREGVATRQLAAAG